MIDQIKKRAKKFEDEKYIYGVNYLIGVDSDGDQVTEVDGHNSYCCDCREVVEAEYNKKLSETNNEFDYNCSDEEFRQVVKIIMTQQFSAESDDYRYCENCGKLLITGVLHTFSQEIDHWLDDSVSVHLNDLDDSDCFILNDLIQNAANKYPKLIEKLKQKIENQKHTP